MLAKRMTLTTAAVMTAAATCLNADLDIPWHSIDAGGAASSGGSYELIGDIGQPDAGESLSGGACTITGGFLVRPGEPCIADFNGDTVVNTIDVLVFLNAWTDGDSSADTNGDTIINSLDVLAFLNLWVDGC